jgi:hypothetical protein
MKDAALPPPAEWPAWDLPSGMNLYVAMGGFIVGVVFPFLPDINMWSPWPRWGVFTGPCTDALGATGTVTEMVNIQGIAASADSLSGTYTTDVLSTVSVNGQPTTYTRHQEGTWSATRNG